MVRRQRVNEGIRMNDGRPPSSGRLRSQRSARILNESAFSVAAYTSVYEVHNEDHNMETYSLTVSRRRLASF
jgi:hypothetical protein